MIHKIIYTLTDEAPMLATHAFLPIVQAFSKTAGVMVEKRDISLAARILAAFPDYLNKDKQVPDALAELREWVKDRNANIIKLPNISASVPQIQAAVKELRVSGFDVPEYPDETASDRAKESETRKAIRLRYDRVKGSAVNPVLREGNSDRRCAEAVKMYARKNPHPMGAWSPDSRTHVASMEDGDFYGTEKSIRVKKSGSYRIEFIGKDSVPRVLKSECALENGMILDAAVMSRGKLRGFLKKEIEDARTKNILFSIHLKATMMKVSDPVIFGTAVSVFFAPVFEKHGRVFDELGVRPDLGMGDLESKLLALEEAKREEILRDIRQCYRVGPDMAMVDSHRGISNLHVPSDIIIDASMPAAIRNSGRMWDAKGEARDFKALIPDRSYAGVYQTTIDFCRQHGAFNPATMGSVANVGLMAQKAEEYGSHDRTFIAPDEGLIRAVGNDGEPLLSQEVKEGDLFRMCHVTDEALSDWVKLAVHRTRSTGIPAVFWLDENRAHDAQVIAAVREALRNLDTSGMDFPIMNPSEACLYTLERTAAGKDSIAVTGNVLRDYLTDLFPILELGTSAKMLSIVHLIHGGGLFETGAGGSAPKHVKQFLHENHLRWDSLGEYLALAVSYEHLADRFANERARLLGKTLNVATALLLENRKSPSRLTGELDNRGSHFYLTLYWARALAEQDDDRMLKRKFTAVARELTESEEEIVDELIRVQGTAVDIGGYYRPDAEKIKALMRPSARFNAIIDML